MQQTVAGRNCEKQTLKQIMITSAQVSEWMQQQLAKAHEIHDYANITVGISSYREQVTSAEFNIYCGQFHKSENHNNIEKCFDDLAAIPLRKISAFKRDLAAKLLDEADALDIAEAMENQPILTL
jgi:hypothetical protein